MTLAHNFPCKNLGCYAYHFILDAGNGVAPFLLLQLLLLLHGLHDGQITALSI